MFPVSGQIVFVVFFAVGALSADIHSDNGIGQPEENISETAASHQPRFGLPISYGNDLQGFNSGMTQTPVKIELGGIFLGTLIGLGAVLIVPKLAHLFSSHNSGHVGYSGSSYSRADNDNVMVGIKRFISRIDETLQANKIDSTACLERAVCTSTQFLSQKTADDLIVSAANSSVVNFIIDGSKLKTALEKGLNRENCTNAYPQCAFNKNSLMMGLKTMMSSNTI
ncbi:uncharacterized protein LOC106664075 [Cimex lectularius]|uniref:Uncharacterized protein n=1 Tax=Cimex lectularius TaxID=79782 RepID=A0A8I6SLJ2_CIMLE|nr:uncharacterized protein LOC106664075 [Cimex lectularius]